jgi:clan AA aspartic protease (TIGR02281 family)
VLIVAGLAGCATTGPVDSAIQRRNAEAVKVCSARFPDVDSWLEPSSGQLFARIPRDRPSDHTAFFACVDAEVKRRTPGHAGRLSDASPSQATIRVYMNGSSIMAPVTVNGTFHGRLVVDTGASLTMLTAETVRSLGIAMPADGPAVRLRLADGRIILRPVVRIASLRVGGMIVEDLEVVVGEQVAAGDGLLGENFLRHFRITIDRGEPNRLVLEARPDRL